MASLHEIRDVTLSTYDPISALQALDSPQFLFHFLNHLTHEYHFSLFQLPILTIAEGWRLGNFWSYLHIDFSWQRY